MRWKKEDSEYLVSSYGTSLSINEISKKLNRSRRAIIHKAARLGLSRIFIPQNKPLDPNYRKLVDKKYYEKNKLKIYTKKRQRIKNYKNELVKLLGGKCQTCGYNKSFAALDFHHKSDKEQLVSVLLNGSSKEKLLKEANKCILLCANCHRELHYKDP